MREEDIPTLPRLWGLHTRFLHPTQPKCQDFNTARHGIALPALTALHTLM